MPRFRAMPSPKRRIELSAGLPLEWLHPSYRKKPWVDSFVLAEPCMCGSGDGSPSGLRVVPPPAIV